VKELLVAFLRSKAALGKQAPRRVQVESQVVVQFLPLPNPTAAWHSSRRM